MFSPTLKKSIVFLKYALKMDLVKGEWFNLYVFRAIMKESLFVESVRCITIFFGPFIILRSNANRTKKYIENRLIFL